MAPPPLPNLSACKKLGFIVPSSNTALEPLTSSILSSLPSHNIIPLFTRIRVTTVGTDPTTTAQFSTTTLIAAAQLLADAEADAILWNGTSGMWTGESLEADQVLADAMTQATGIRCSTTTLATVAAVEFLGVSNLGVAVPYSPDLAERVRQFFVSTKYGWNVTAVATLDPVPAGNLAIAKSSLADIKAVVRKACSPSSPAGNKAEAVIVACTNWPAASLAEEVEAETGVVVVDSITVTTWHGLRMLGCHDAIRGWGGLLSNPHKTGAGARLTSDSSSKRVNGEGNGEIVRV
ncbi:hypothetical protein LTR62_004998 [Meristemomyces frigidus]|uniref:Asp/Glu racemase n=1 Tax=Meristemomyces frigidus TaxID=1508187 RepID=A0AAN7TP86_9PEZI|nr:hypothetical protein LTR62_004998 [Meristemomyces frigidus]